MAAQEVLILLFVAASIPNEPISCRITDAIAKNSIKTKAGLIDEIVHIALDRTVVIAKEDHPLLVVEKHPAREVNRAYASQAAAPHKMPRAVINSAKNADNREKPY